MKKIKILIVIILTALSISAQEYTTIGNKQFRNVDGEWFQIYSSQEFRVVENKITIKFNPDANEQEITNFAVSNDLTLHYHDTILGYYVYLIPENEDIIDVLSNLHGHQLTQIVETQTYGVLLTNGYLSDYCDDERIISNDEFSPKVSWHLLSSYYQWYIPKIGVDCAWQLETGNNSVIVAILDTGVDYNHQDIGMGEDGYQNIIEGYNYVDDNNDAMDNCPNGICHGTRVAGLVAAKTNNNKGIAGIAGGWGNEGVRIMPVKVGHTSLTEENLIEGIYHAIDSGAHIVNLSLAIDQSSYIDDALELAYQHGLLLVAAAGQNETAIFYPATHPDVIAVGGTDINDNKPETFHYGAELELAAPGHNIRTTDKTYHYIVESGTSLSSAIISGVSALLWSYNPCFTNDDIRLILRETADKVGNVSYINGHSEKFGYGRVNAYEAILMATGYFDDLYISENTTWNNDEAIRADLIIETGATLTINAKVAIDANSKIIVEPGAKLIINGGILTSSANCAAGYWQGIEVWGNNAEHQWPDAEGNLAQGYLELNDAVIENAIDAVVLWKPGDNSSTGGILIAENTVFRNNRRSVHALNYKNFHPVNLKDMDNRTSFTRCTFDMDENYHGAETFYKHVDLALVNGVKFNACKFILSPDTPFTADHNMAIGSYGAGFSATGICTIFGQYECLSYDSCSFTGFHWAINATNASQTTNTFNVGHSIFNNNAYGIRTSNINNFTVLNSEFNIGYNEPESDPCATEGKAASGYGIHMTSCTGFAIEVNYFTKASGAPTGNYTGILCKNSETVHDVIYLNTFTGLSYGNFAEGDNRYDSDDQFGLEYQCNFNTGNNRDFIVTGGVDPRIRGYMGSMSREAGNIFSTGVELPDGHFKNTGLQVINYCYNTNPPVYYTPFYVMPIPNAGANTCPSNYGGGSGGSTKDVLLTEDEKQEAELEFATNLIDFNNVKALFDNLKDGGNTQALKTEVETAWPSDMWALRDELLGKSPHLSQEVLMAAADKTDVLPESILFEILSANPDELRKEELISHLENKDQPLPAYMISILRQLAGGVTYKTILQQDMARYFAGKTQAAYMLIRSCLNDTVSDYAYLRTWLNNLDNLNADMQIVAAYLAEENYTAAQAMLNLIPATRNLEGNALAGYNDYKTMMEMQMAWQQQNRSIFELDSLEIAILLDFAENTSGKAALMARGLLEYAYGYHFCNCLPVDDPAAWKSTAMMPGSDVDNGLSIQAVPNPASTWVAFNFTLPVHINEAVLQITDVHGRNITSFVIKSKQGQQVWDIRDAKKGTYLYSLKAGTLRKNGKLIIK
jgi:subtilisin family serine protease